MNDAYNYSATIVDELNELEERFQESDVADVIEELNALDWEYTLSLNGYLRSVRMTRTVGGPSCYVDFNGNGIANVTTYWGADVHTIGADVPAIESIVFDWIEDMR